jgi:hypothetical protein
MLTNKNMRLIAEYLVRWCESEIAAGKALANGDDDKHCDGGADSDPHDRIRNRKRYHDQQSDFDIRQKSERNQDGDRQ